MEASKQFFKLPFSTNVPFLPRTATICLSISEGMKEKESQEEKKRENPPW